MTTAANPKTDFFISYNTADSRWAEWVAWVLEEQSYTTILQAWDFRPGESFILRMNEAVQQSTRTIAILSPDYVDAKYPQAEWAAAFAADPTSEKGLLLPVRVRDCILGGLLSQIIYVDLVKLDEDTAKERLLAGVKCGRAKPETSPSFPAPTSRSVASRPTFPGTRRITRTPWLLLTIIIVSVATLGFLFKDRIAFMLNNSTLPISPSSSSAQQTYQVSASRWVGYAPLHIANAKGWMPHWRVFDRSRMTSEDVIEHINSKKDHAFVLTFDSFYNDTTSGGQYNVNPTAILVLDQSSGGDGVVAHKVIKSFKDLRGKRVGMWPGSSAEIFLADELSTEGVKFSELTQPPVSLLPQELVKLFCKNKLDAVALFSPFLEQAEECGGHTLRSSTTSASPIFDGLFLHQQSASQDDKEAILELLAAWDKGVQFIRQESPESFGELASVLELSVPQARKAYSRVNLFTVDENVTKLADWSTIAGAAKDFSQRAGMWHRGTKSVIRVDQTYVYDYLKRRNPQHTAP